MEINHNFGILFIEAGRALCELPKISVVYATDKMFHQYVYGFDSKEIKAVKKFFKVYKKHGMLTDELKVKKKIFKNVVQDKRMRKQEEALPYFPNRLVKVKLPDEFLNYSAKELGTLLRKFSFQSYLDKRKPQKMTDDDFSYSLYKNRKINVENFNRILNTDISKIALVDDQGYQVKTTPAPKQNE